MVHVVFGLGAVAGLILIYLSLFMYETEYARAKDALEGLWVRSDEGGNALFSRHAQLLRRLAGSAADGIARIYGPRFLGWRFLGFSSCYAIGSFPAALLLFALIMQHFFDARGLLAMRNGLLFVLFLCVLFWIVAASVPRLAFLAWGPAFALVEYVLLAGRWLKGDEFTDLFVTILLGLSISVVFHAAFVAAAGWALRGLRSEGAGALNLAALLKAMGLFAILCIASIFFPVAVAVGVKRLPGPVSARLTGMLSQGFLMAAFANFAAALFALVVVLIASLMVALHWVCWPIWKRALYRFAETDLAKHRKFLGSLGTLMSTSSFPLVVGSHPLMKSLAPALKKVWDLTK